MLSICFQNQSSSTNIAIDAFLFEGPFFYFYIESVHLSLFTSRSKHLCELCIDSYILAYCTCYITLYWQYPWDIHVTSWKQPLKLYLPLSCFNTSTLNLLLYELTLMQDFLMLVFKYYSWKVFALWFNCLLIALTLFRIAAFISYVLQ